MLKRDAFSMYTHFFLPTKKKKKKQFAAFLKLHFDSDCSRHAFKPVTTKMKFRQELQLTLVPTSHRSEEKENNSTPFRGFLKWHTDYGRS